MSKSKKIVRNSEQNKVAGGCSGPEGCNGPECAPVCPHCGNKLPPHPHHHRPHNHGHGLNEPESQENGPKLAPPDVTKTEPDPKPIAE